MIKLISSLHETRLVQIGGSETTVSVERQLIEATGESFEIQLIETSNNRTLPRDEVLMDEREYFINYLRLPIKGGV